MDTESKAAENAAEAVIEDDFPAEAAEAEAVAAEITSEPQKSEAKSRSRFSAFMREYGYLIAAFTVPMVLMWLIYIGMEVFPFGENSVLVLDLNGQYVYFFEALRNIILNGGSLLYSFSRSLGGEFLGIFAYYVSSPFSLITVLFPAGAITEALLVMILLKCGSCGLTFGYYIHKTRHGFNRIATVMFSTMYALTSYAIVYQHNTMWLDCVIFLPLLSLGIENMIKYGKYKMFVICLALSVISNFYIGYMVCIYVVLYFFYYWFAHSKDGGNNPMSENHHFIKTFGRVALYSAIALGISAVIILSAYYSISFGKNTFSNPTYSFTQRYDLLDIITKLFPGSYDTVRPDGLPWIYCGVFSLLTVPLFFMSGKYSVRERIATGVLLLVFVFSFNIQAVDMFWHGLQRPNWLECRYSFMFCFIFLVAAVKGYETLKETKPKALLAISVVYMLLIFIIQKLDYSSMPDIESIWLTVVCVIAYFIASYSFMHAQSENHATMVICVLICLEMFTAGLLNLIALDNDVHFSSRTSYVSNMEPWRAAFDKLKQYDSGFYRSEKTYHRKTNDAMALDINGLSNSTSTLNKDTLKLLERLGYCSKSHWSKYLGGTPVSDSLLGLKYILSDSEMDEPFDLVFTTEGVKEGQTIYAYSNSYALSLAAASSPMIKDLNPEDYYNPFELMNAMVGAMLGQKKPVQLFVPLQLKAVSDSNVTVGYVSGHKKYSADGSGGDARINYTFEVPEEEVQIYAYFASTYPREVDMKINGIASGTYFGNETTRIVKIGEKGSYMAAVTNNIEITLVLKKDPVYMANNSGGYLYYLDEEVFKSVMPLLSECNYIIDPDYSEDHFRGKITTTVNKSTVYTSIPYDEGWNIYLDGEKVEIFKTVGALIAFDAPTPGEHDLEMVYMPKQVKTGMIISAVSLAVFAALFALDTIIGRKNRKNGKASVCGESVTFPFPVRCGGNSQDTPEHMTESDPMGDSLPDAGLEPSSEDAEAMPDESGVKQTGEDTEDSE
ncbi:MAG: YfhO family protein [Clostridia bacterium]|nr:YfhO family protein [Clostridia bacterium]